MSLSYTLCKNEILKCVLTEMIWHKLRVWSVRHSHHLNEVEKLLPRKSLTSMTLQDKKWHHIWEREVHVQRDIGKSSLHVVATRVSIQLLAVNRWPFMHWKVRTVTATKNMRAWHNRLPCLLFTTSLSYALQNVECDVTSRCYWRNPHHEIILTDDENHELLRSITK